MRTFNFKTMVGSKERKIFYMENYNKPLTEAEFIVIVQSWKRTRGKTSTRSASAARYQYRRLKEVYGFFQ